MLSPLAKHNYSKSNEIRSNAGREISNNRNEILKVIPVRKITRKVTTAAATAVIQQKRSTYGKATAVPVTATTKEIITAVTANTTAAAAARNTTMT